MLHGIVKRSDDVGEVARAVRREGLERKDLGLGRDQVNEPRSHRAMTEGDIRRAIQNRCGGLIKHGSRRLLHVPRLLILSASVGVTGLHPRDIEPLGGAWLVSREIVTLQKDGIENWVIRVYACVNDGDDSFAGYTKAVLAIREADDLGSRLGRITVPNDRAVILDRRRIVQAGWNAWKRGLRHREEAVRFNTDDP